MLRLRILLVAAVLVVSGCGDPNAATVAGKVTVDGQPLDEGTVTFVPADGQSPTAGGTIKGGAYSVRLSAGKMKVSISAAKVVGQKKVYNTPNSPVMPITAERLPLRYNEKTELTLEVKAGSNTKDWALDEK